MKTTERDAPRAAWTTVAGAPDGSLTRADATPRVGATGAVQAPPLDPDAEPRGSLWRYTRYKLKDFLRERGSWMLALGGLTLAIFRINYYSAWADFVGPLSRYRGRVPNELMDEAWYFRGEVVKRFSVMMFMGVLMATYGIVSRDRERGFQRFLFAKPLRATRYYLQSYFVNGAGFLGIIALLLASTAAAFARGVPIVGILGVAAGTYAAFGGMVFLLSTFARYDVALAVVLTAVGGGAHDLAREYPRWAPLWKVVSWLLPPYDAFSHALNRLSHGNSSAALAAVLPAFAYGAAYVAAGLAIIRRRSVAT